MSDERRCSNFAIAHLSFYLQIVEAAEGRHEHLLQVCYWGSHVGVCSALEEQRGANLRVTGAWSEQQRWDCSLHEADVFHGDAGSFCGRKQISIVFIRRLLTERTVNAVPVQAGSSCQQFQDLLCAGLAVFCWVPG